MKFWSSICRINQYIWHNRMTVISFIIIMCLCAVFSETVFCHAETDEITFDGTEEERAEMEHMLLAKLVYDYLDGYDGMTVEEYVCDNPALYGGEIWAGSGITYEALYNSLIGDWTIYMIFNHNKTTGMYAVAFQRENQVILTFRGSEMFTDEFALDDSNDWTGTDFKFALLNELSGQFEDADSSYRGLVKKLKKDGIDVESDMDVELTLSGHSLGGALVVYESLVTGLYGYAFDGACGHVIDLVYYYQYLNIDDFTGIDRIKFCNYTDEEGYFVADIIQHTNVDAMFQIDRKTNLDNLNENTLIPRLSDAGSHILWSSIGHEGRTVFLNERVNADEAGYSYAPKEPYTFDITKNILEAGVEGFDAGLPWGRNAESAYDYEYMLGALMGVVKDGRVVLGTSQQDALHAGDGIGVSGAFSVNTVMYGGAGDDILIGYTADDVLIGGAGDNFLDGNLGNDTYIIDASPSSHTTIHDIGGEKTTVILRNFDFDFASVRDILFSSGELHLEDGQTLGLSVCQSPENVEFYFYREADRELCYAGTYADCLNGVDDSETDRACPEQKFAVDEKYVVFLEGRGSLDVRNNAGEIIHLSNLQEDRSDIVSSDIVDVECGRAYINYSEGKESILLVMPKEYEIYVTNDKQRVNMAIGRYSDADGMIACERKYNRNFDAYRVYFSDTELDDGAQGDISWQDSLHSGLNMLIEVFR